MTIVFASPVLNSAAQKTLNVENWNNFVRALKASCLDLPACYSWASECDLGDQNKYDKLLFDLAMFVSSESILEALAVSTLLMVAVSTFVVQGHSIAYILEYCFDLKYAIDDSKR